MNKVGAVILEKAANFFVRVLSLTNREGWPVEGSNAGESVTADSVLSLSPAWACIGMWMGVMGTLPFGVFRKNPRTGVPEEVDGHWLKQLLEGPNLEQTSVDLMEFMAASLEIRGNAYFEKRRLTPSGSVIALYPLRPDFTSVRRGQNGRLLYRFTDPETGMLREEDQDNIWHIRGPGGSPLGGLSTLSFGRQAFGLALATDKAAATTFRNGVRPSGVLKFKNFLDKAKRDAVKNSLLEQHTAAMNAGKPLVLEGGTEWTQISFSPEDAQMLESRAFSVEDICRWFQMPPILVGHSKDVTAWGSGIYEIVLGFIKFGVTRRVRRIEKSAGRQLLSPAERAQGLYLRFDMEGGLLRGDPKARADFYEIMTRIGAFEIDLVREREGLPPLPNGEGAMPRVQAQYIPLGMDPTSGRAALLPPVPKTPVPKPQPQLPPPAA